MLVIFSDFFRFIGNMKMPIKFSVGDVEGTTKKHGQENKREQFAV